MNYYEDYSKILNDFGVYPHVIYMNKSKNDSIYTQYLNKNQIRTVYSYIESGFPIIASLGKKIDCATRHVVNIIGHTIDYAKECIPENNFIDSSEFLSQFIVIDDNFFPYQLLSEVISCQVI